jgi:ketosteroid isomerase-like protein
MPIKILFTIAAFMLMMVSNAVTAQTQEDLRQQVEDTERAFAKTMADRDHDAFVSFLSEEAVFFSGPNATSGKQQVAELWKPLYEGPDAPFSWQPEQLMGTFTSIWRQEAPGTWRIVFDKGNEACKALNTE